MFDGSLLLGWTSDDSVSPVVGASSCFTEDVFDMAVRAIGVIIIALGF